MNNFLWLEIQWTDILVMVAAIAGSALSAEDIPNAKNDSWAIRFSVSLYATTIVGVFSAFQDYKDPSGSTVTWVHDVFGMHFPAIGYIIVLGLGCLTLARTVLIPLISIAQSKQKIILLASAGTVAQLLILFHVLTLNVATRMDW